MGDIALFGFGPKLKITAKAWKEGDNIYIRVTPQFKIGMDNEDIMFSGPFNLLQKLKSVAKTYPGVDLGLEFGIGGALEIKWNTTADTITDLFGVEQWDVGIWVEVKLKGQYITLLASVTNPVVAIILDEYDNILEKVNVPSILDLLTGEVKFKLAFSLGKDSDGWFAKLDLTVDGNLINIDLDLDKDPEVTAGIYEREREKSANNWRKLYWRPQHI